jgi:hypothetical protein
MWARWKAVYASWDLDVSIARLRREEKAALTQAGRRFRTASLEPGPEPSEPVTAALARVAELEEHARALAERLEGSLEADRRDYRETGSGIGRGLIVARGILDRLVLRDEAWRARHELPGRQAELGARVMADEVARERLPAEDRERALAASAALERARSARAEVLAPFGGEVMPAWLRAVRSELETFGSFLKDELTKKVLLRLPALAAMAAVWWIAQHFSSSRFETSLNHFTGEGRTGLSAAALEQLNFWLPLVVAASMAYLLAALTKRIRRRYLGEDGPSPTGRTPEREACTGAKPASNPLAV